VLPPALEPLVLGQSFNIQVAASVPRGSAAPVAESAVVEAQIPVEGAVVSVQLNEASTAGAETVSGVSQRGLTDSAGELTISVPSPDRPGDYAINVQIGRAKVELPMTVIGTVISLRSQVLGATSTQFGFEVTVYDESGNPASDGTVLDVTTSTGTVEPSAVLTTTSGHAEFAVVAANSYSSPIEVSVNTADPTSHATITVQIPHIWFPSFR